MSIDKNTIKPIRSIHQGHKRRRYIDEDEAYLIEDKIKSYEDILDYMKPHTEIEREVATLLFCEGLSEEEAALELNLDDDEIYFIRDNLIENALGE